ncbi:MAG: DUF368 domain-containing protein [Erysipelotrichaceae bacterium]
MKELISGIAIGIANIIPGVSGGTMMVVMGMFNRIMDAISEVFKVKNPNRMQDIAFLMKILVGALIGLVAFAKVIEFLFARFEVQTMWWFIGMVALSIPVFMKKEMKNDKIRIVSFVAGLAVIFLIAFLNPGNGDVVLQEFPINTPMHLAFMVFIGVIAGFTMLLPGVSGSMVLLIIGQYHLFKGYLAAVTQLDFNIFLPLAFMGSGILLGIVLSAKVTKYLLEKSPSSRVHTLSFILGLVVASSIVLIPFTSYTLGLALTCLATFGIGGAMVLMLEKLVK